MVLSQKNILSVLENKTPGLKVSIYIPTNTTADTKSVLQDKTRFKNALQVVRNDHAYNERELGSTMKKLYDELLEDDVFWKHQDQGLAVLFDHDGYEYFHLPYEVTKVEYVTDHFVVSPLVVMASADTSFYVLDVNFTEPKLYYGARNRLEKINSKNMPGSFEDEVGRDEYRRQLQHQAGGVGAFHGHGEEGALDEDSRRYLKKIASATDAYLADKNAILLLAGTTNRTGNIRGELSYDKVYAQTLDGNYEKASETELYALCEPIVMEHLRNQREIIVDELANTPPQRVVMGRKEIEEASASGRVEKLLFPAYRMTKDSVRRTNYTKLIVELPADLEEIEHMVTSVVGRGGEVVAIAIGAYEILNQPKAICRF